MSKFVSRRRAVLHPTGRQCPFRIDESWLAEKVLSSVGGQERANFGITSVTQAEILYGVQVLAASRRRNAIAAAAMFNEEFAGRIFSFDSKAARAYAAVAAERKRLGRPISQFDAQIAAIVLAAGRVLATRNVGQVEHCGIDLVDP